MGLLARALDSVKSLAPRVQGVGVTVLNALGDPSTNSEYALILLGTVGPYSDRSAGEEVFCVALANHSLTTITRLVDCFDAPRLGDYQLDFERIDGDSIVVSGKGAMYGDSPLRRAYPRLTP